MARPAPTLSIVPIFPLALCHVCAVAHVQAERHVEVLSRLALQFVAAVPEISEANLLEAGSLQIKVGINSGPVIGALTLRASRRRCLCLAPWVARGVPPLLLALSGLRVCMNHRDWADLPPTLPSTGGIIGRLLPRYRIFGDTVRGGGWNSRRDGWRASRPLFLPRAD